MHKKSFTFGLGSGILVVTGIFYLLVSLLQTGPVVEELSNAQIRERVEAQGYVILSGEEWLQLEQSAHALPELPEPTPAPTPEPLTPTDDTGNELSNEEENAHNETDETASETTAPPTMSVGGFTPVSPPAQAQQPASPPAQAPAEPAEQASEDEPTQPQEVPELVFPQPHFITVEIPPFMIAADIAELLHTRGVIDNPVTFTQFLISEGYTTRLWAGESTFHTNMSYAAALHALTTANENNENNEND